MPTRVWGKWLDFQGRDGQKPESCSRAFCVWVIKPLVEFAWEHRLNSKFRVDGQPTVTSGIACPTFNSCIGDYALSDVQRRPQIKARFRHRKSSFCFSAAKTS